MWLTRFLKRLDPRAGHRGAAKSLREIFAEIYRTNGFLGVESRSGAGSGVEQTRVVRRELPGILAELGVRSMLDVPCGDWFWMKSVDLGEIDYVGADIVEEIVDANRRAYQRSRRTFQVLDVIEGQIPTVDLILCRDLLVHLSFADCRRAIANMKRSGSTFLLTTTFTGRTANEELRKVWRALNLQIPPFSFPEPLRVVNEECTEGGNAFADKSLALWRLADL